MATNQQIHNPQSSRIQDESRLTKSPQKIGKIYSRQFSSQLKSSILLKDTNQSRLKQNIPLQKQSGQIVNNSVYLEPFDKSYQMNDISSCIDIRPVTNKSFRINKLISLQVQKKIIRKKTPESIGKLSASKLSFDRSFQGISFKATETKQERSPGNLRKSKRASLNQKRSVEMLDQSIQTSKFYNVPEEQENPEALSIGLNLQKHLQLQSVKDRNDYLKGLICKNINEADSQSYQAPIPKKQNNRNYPISTGKNKSKTDNKLNFFLEKIEKNSQLLQQVFPSSIFASKYKNQTIKNSDIINKLDTKKNVIKMNTQKIKRQKVHDFQNVLPIQRSNKMKISPQIKISFTVKTPRILKNNIQREPSDDKGKEDKCSQLKRQFSKVSIYSSEMNKDFNNRKPKLVNMLIDPSPGYLAKEDSQSEIDLSKYYQFMMDNKIKINQNIPNRQKSRFSEPQIEVINLSTRVSKIKQLLIQSMQTINLRIQIPFELFENTKINIDSRVKHLHPFVQKVFHSMQIKPEIVTMKRYQNAFFAGVFNTSSQDYTSFKSIIYHYNNNIYVGEWKQNQTNTTADYSKVDGSKHGLGLQIIYNKQEQIQNQNSQRKNLQIQIFYGQFSNNSRSGYGIKTKFDFIDENLSSQSIQIGSWSNSKKHGWVKTYINCRIQQSAQYQIDQLKNQRSLRGFVDAHKYLEGIKQSSKH